MANPKLSDGEGKDILRSWPSRTNKLWRPPKGRGFWIRALPKTEPATCPSIHSPGANLFKTQPDGLWVYIHTESSNYADVVCVEVCGTAQNLNDKRSRYIPASHALVLTCPLLWLLEDMRLPNGGHRPRWKASATFTHKPTADLDFPIRHMRILYALPNALYRDWKGNHTPTGYEYYCRHGSLDSYQSQYMQHFLRRMAFESHYMTLK